MKQEVQATTIQNAWRQHRARKTTNELRDVRKKQRAAAVITRTVKL